MNYELVARRKRLFKPGSYSVKSITCSYLCALVLLECCARNLSVLHSRRNDAILSGGIGVCRAEDRRLGLRQGREKALLGLILTNVWAGHEIPMTFDANWREGEVSSFFV